MQIQCHRFLQTTRLSSESPFCYVCLQQQNLSRLRKRQLIRSAKGTCLRFGGPARAAADTAKLDSEAVRRREKEQGRSTYSPESYKELVGDAVESVCYALDDGVKRLEVDFPTLTGDSEYHMSKL